ncbi:S-layer homology domain-containing protein [Lysinibacillus endophyticus]|uniref:S-layer homology domain-containing protein n=1 Tax=Ureibacillus endophyticus TaxID=1978490 RepID=UPI0031368EC7
MTQYKKFVATAATATLVASAIVPVASAAGFTDVENNGHAQAINALADQGIINGYPDGTFKPNKELTRSDVVKLLGKYLVSKGYSVPADAKTKQRFNDVPVNYKDQELVEYAALVKDAGVFQGSNNNLNASNKITRGQMALVVVRALDALNDTDLVSFVAEQDFEREVIDLDSASKEQQGAIDVLDFFDITKTPNYNPKSSTTRGQFASFLYRAINVELEVPEVELEVKDVVVVDAKTLNVTLSDDTTHVVTLEKALEANKETEVTFTIDEKEYSAKVTYVVEAIKVESVKAINLKQVAVTFNNEVDVESAENEANYALTGDLTVADAKADGNTVVLTLAANAEQQASVELTVENVKDENGSVVEKTTKAVKFFDATAPAVSSVEAIGPKTLKVNFSEPLKEAPNFKLNNGTLAIVNTSFTAGDSEAILTLGTNLSEGSHSLEVSGGKDYANFAIEKQSTSFNYVLDVTAPTATVKSATETQVVLEFSEDVVNADNENVEYYHTYKGTNAYKASNVTVDGKEVTLTFENPLPAGDAKIFVSYKNEKGTKIQDATGNVFEAATLNANVVSDVTAPTVSKVVVTDNTKIDVTFSESVLGATDKANYILKDAAGDVVAISSVTNLSGNTYRIATPVLNGGSYTLTVKNVTDASIRENKMADYTTNVTVEDLVAPTIVDTDNVTNGTQVKQIADNKVKIEFSEVMNASSITNKANYKFNNAALGAKDTVEAVDGNKAVVITIDGGLDGDDTVSVGRVQDVAGNYIEQFETVLDIVALSNVDVDKVEVTGKNSIKLTFDEVITNATVNDFEYTLDDTADTVEWKTPVAISTTVADGKTYITLTVADITDTTAAKIAVRTTDAEATESAKNVYGTALLFSSTEAEDKYAPELEGATFDGTVGDGNDDTVVITFSEDLYVASVQESDFTVEGYTIKGIEVDGETVTLTVKDSTTGTATPKVTLVGEVEDTLRNVAKGPKEVTITE